MLGNSRRQLGHGLATQPLVVVRIANTIRVILCLALTLPRPNVEPLLRPRSIAHATLGDHRSELIKAWVLLDQLNGAIDDDVIR